MKSMGSQFLDIMKPRINDTKNIKKGLKKAGDSLIEGVQDRSKRGKTVKGGKWNNNYNERYAKRKGKSPPVDLRDEDLSMNRLRSVSKGRSVGIRGAAKLGYHDKGTATGGKRRQLFPDNKSQVPEKFRRALKKHIHKILSGRNE